jgi:hypothetical protein
MESFIKSNQKGARAVGDACRSIDWIPKELQELVDLHGPKESDMDLEGYLNKMRLQDEARKLFTELKTKHSFCNFFQFQQAVKPQCYRHHHHRRMNLLGMLAMRRE